MEVVDVSGVPTHVYSLSSTPRRSSSLVLVISGSPGMAHYYVPFADKLFQLALGSCDVAVMSHAGHSPGCLRSSTQGVQGGSSSHPGNGSDRNWFDLEDQIAHKLSYCKNVAGAYHSLYLIGHSLGCYIILEMLKELNPEIVKKVVFLFPMIEKMSTTRNAISWNPFITTWRGPFTALVWLGSSFPEWFRHFVLNRHFHSTPEAHREHVIRGTMNIDSTSIHNILCMAEQEMNEVITPPFEVIDANIGKIVFYYGREDHWNMESSYSDMAERYPQGDINLCSKGCSHAFVEEHSDEMAEFVYNKFGLLNE